MDYGLKWMQIPEDGLDDFKAYKREGNGDYRHAFYFGENYHLLKNLRFSHGDMFDVIYIDPPYNTGTNFVYKDSRFTKEYPNGKLIKKDDPAWHSSWLSFMSKRLEIARDLLTDDGFIAISIDDNELYNLKLLCDKIFGTRNFIKTLIWKTSSSVMKSSNDFRKDHEYILMFAKDKSKCVISKSYNEGLVDKFKNPDNDPKGPYISTNAAYSTGSKSNIFEIKTPGGRIIKRSWKFTKEQFDNNEIDLILKDNNVPRIKQYKADYNLHNKTLSTLFTENFPTITVAKKDLKKMLGKEFEKDIDLFATVKPPKLIQTIIERHPNKNANVLDFFAGSGTTLTSTIDANNNDGGHRTFFGCTEPIDVVKRLVCKRIDVSEEKTAIFNEKNIDIKSDFHEDFIEEMSKYAADIISSRFKVKKELVAKNDSMFIYETEVGNVAFYTDRDYNQHGEFMDLIKEYNCSQHFIFAEDNVDPTDSGHDTFMWDWMKEFK